MYSIVYLHQSYLGDGKWPNSTLRMIRELTGLRLMPRLACMNVHAAA